MQTALSVIGLVFGFILGFAFNHHLMMYIFKGEDIKEILKDKTKKIWIGTLGWFVILISTWICWMIARHLGSLVFS